jgi:hypothetical protein
MSLYAYTAWHCIYQHTWLHRKIPFAPFQSLLKHKSNRLSRNVGTELPLYAA